MRVNDFDFVAPYYGLLSRLVFGNTLKRAQKYFLFNIPESARVLIIGGGTGDILLALDQLGRAIEVVYVERSAEMLQLSKGRSLGNITVEFIHGTQDNIPASPFDVIITAFFLDVFDKRKLPVVMGKLHHCLKPSGLWLQTDFVRTGKRRHRLLIRLMYHFFRIVACMEGSCLLNFDKYFHELEYENVASEYFYQRMIRTTLYRRA